MSSICQSFESNAWRSDLCSHCFQSREEHERLTKADDAKEASTLGSRYQSVLNHCRSSYRGGVQSAATVGLGALTPAQKEAEVAATNGAQAASILKSPGKSSPPNKTAKSVNFPGEDDAHEQVIGYGGIECLESDTDDDVDHSNRSTDDEEDWPFTEEERAIHNQTQKNTSFNSVSRNLLASEVATFKSHGISTPSSNGTKSAPLVTIRAFGQDAAPAVKKSPNEAPKINPVSPMRNGQALSAEAARENSVKFNQARDEAKDTPDEQEEKFTSFTDPTPSSTTTLPPTTTTSAGNEAEKNKRNSEKDPKAIVLQSSRVASGRIDEQNNNAKASSKNSTLSRKPPVWREKPRIPIKPQSVITIQQATAEGKADNEAIAQSRPVYAVPKPRKDESEKAESGDVKKDEQTKMEAIDASTEPQRSDRAAEARVTETGHGQVTVHFMSIDDKPDSAAEKERSALERLDQLSDQKEPELSEGTPPDSLEYAPKSQPPEEEKDGDREPFESRHNSTRGLTRSAFEALRANLAGSLELSRMVQQQQQHKSPTPNGSVKRQAPPTPTHEVEKADRAALENGEEKQQQSIPPVPPPPPPPAPPVQEPQPVLKVKRSTERAMSASPRFRNSLVCSAPDGEQVESQPRSVSLTRVERCDSERQNKPSIRKIIKERATQLLSMADSSSKTSGRLSRADRFAAETGKKAKGRFSSIRKLLGLKKEVEIEQPVEVVSPKVRPEIVHPIDLRPFGQVEVVAKPEHVITLTTSQSESVYSGDSGRNSSLDFQPSDSSLASGSSGSDGGSSPAGSLLSASFKNTTPSGRPKPPPPPRSTYKETSTGSPGTKPARPPPPKSSDLLHIQKASPSLLESRSNSAATEYANLGEVRRAMSPKKPERSASMRTKELRPVSAVNTNINILAVADSRLDGLHYDCVTIGQQQPATGLMKASADEDGYIVPLRMKSTPSFSSSSSAGSSQRLSLTSFNPPSGAYQQPASLASGSDASRRTLRPGGIRQSRMDLHIKLENHYGTVTGANFQALAQLLEQATSKRPLAAHFHELRRIKGLNWNAFGSSTEHDIVLLRTSTVTVLKSTWQGHDLLLSVYHHSLQDNADNKAPFAQPSVVHFHDQVPAPFLSIPGTRAGVEVFPPGQVATLKQLPHIFSVELDGVERMQHCLSILLQVCRALEWLLQQQRPLGRLNHDEMVFYREHSHDAYRILWMAQLQPESELSVGGLSVRETLTGSIRSLAPLLSNALVDKISSVLQRDGHHPLASVLDTLARFLEFALFGPSTDLFEGDPDPIEMFQRWLDVERASALNELIRTQGLWRVKLNIIEEFKLSFLVTTTPQSLLDTSQI